MWKREDGRPLTNLERLVIKEWLDLIVEQTTSWNSIYRVSDQKTFYPTSDGTVFTDEKEAEEYEMKYLMDGYKNED